MTVDPDLDVVADAIREVADQIVLPRWRRLSADEVMEKGPGDLVTVADAEAEVALTRFLGDHLPGSAVIGEEAVSADSAVLVGARERDRVWVIDPIDGTANFVAGSPDFAVMVALVEGGMTTASWIFHPAVDRMYTAIRGGGAFVDGQPLVRSPAPTVLADVRGVAVTRLLEPAARSRVEARASELGPMEENSGASGIAYPQVAEGHLDFVFCWRTLVWDHAPGVLLLEEARGRAARLDGSDYEPWSDRVGLVFAADEPTCTRVAHLLAPDGTP